MLSCWRWWGRLCPIVVRMGSCPVGPLAMGLAAATWLGHTDGDGLYGKGVVGPLAWDIRSGVGLAAAVLVLSPRSRAEMLAECTLAEQGAKGGPGITQSLTLQPAPLCESPAPV